MGGNLLEVLILRDCMHLKEVRTTNLYLSFLPSHILSPLSYSLSICAKTLEFLLKVEVTRLMTAIIGGDFKFLRHLVSG